MTKTAKWSMIGVLAALVLALFAVAGCSSDNAGNNDNGGDNANPATENNDNGNGNNGDNNNGNNNADNNNSNNGNNNNGNQMGDGSSIGEGTVLKVPNGWVAYSQSDMLVLLDSNADVQYQWTAEVNGNTVLKDTDADLPSSGFNDQNSQDVVGVRVPGRRPEQRRVHHHNETGEHVECQRCEDHHRSEGHGAERHVHGRERAGVARPPLYCGKAKPLGRSAR